MASERRVLIDEWFPTGEVGVESVRERSVGQNPPINRLHVWFARRPLVASRAAVLASILPPDTTREEFLKLLGIPHDKDVVAAAEKLAWAKANKVKLSENPFDWERAFKYTPPQPQLDALREKISRFWGRGRILVLDPMAGGGSIPYEALRLGLDVVAGELNPVAYIVLKATLEYPVKFRERLLPAVKEFCEEVHRRAKSELEEFFPKKAGESVYAYLWARTVKCPSCGLVIPLSPNWWLVREEKPTDVAVKLVVAEDNDTCTFEIVSNPKAKGLDPDKGTDVGKSARCPRCRTTVDSKFVKREAQEGRMGHQIYAVSIKVSGKWRFRVPAKEELEAVEKAERILMEKLHLWERNGLVPNEPVPDGLKTRELINFGMLRWRDLFNPRQLLTHLTYLEKFLEVKRELLSKAVSEEDREFYKAVITYGALVFDTCLTYNCILTRWAPDRLVIKSSMDVQAFPFKSSYAEWNQLVDKGGYAWSLEKVLDALEEIIKLLPDKMGNVSVYCGDAASIPLPDKSVDCIVVDPPYYENVMYSEVSDFFYVWLKRLIGDLYPEAFQYELTPKEEEAVANPARFKGIKKAKELANKHYESKIEACFREMKRVLRDDGVMTVMFTHRKAEAWASLARALINAGFTFEASWPIATEPGQKFGKMGKGVLKYTVLLRCRKRTTDKKGLWEEVKEELLEEAERRVRDHSSKGITGPDLLVSVYGPVLGRFADYSQVKDAAGNLKTPSDALNIVAEIVNKFLTQDIKADPETLAYINLLRNFPNLTVEYDLARLITVFGGNISLDRLDVKSGIGAVRIKGSKVEILLSKERQAEGFISPTRPEKLRTLIDVVHACLIQYENVGLKSVITLLSETGRDHRDSGFLSVLKAIAQLGLNGQGDKKLLEEARTAATLLEALGQKAPLALAKGERLDDYL
jgi:adenine-specific DNA methylase